MDILMFGAIGGESFVQGLLTLLVIGVAALVVWLSGRWFFSRPSVNPVVLTVWDGLFVLVGCIVIVNFLLSLIGKPLISW